MGNALGKEIALTEANVNTGKGSVQNYRPKYFKTQKTISGAKE